MDSVVNVKYKLYKEYCRCCGRDFERNEVAEEKEKDIDVAEFMQYLQRTSDNEVFAEDYVGFVNECVFEELNDWLPSGEIATVEREELIKVLKVAYELLKKTKVEIINEEFLQDYLK